eukprot:218332-Prymnesium_polylepis.1
MSANVISAPVMSWWEGPALPHLVRLLTSRTSSDCEPSQALPGHRHGSRPCCCLFRSAPQQRCKSV